LAFAGEFATGCAANVKSTPLVFASLSSPHFDANRFLPAPP
jgi:hypothetical protein